MSNIDAISLAKESAETACTQKTVHVNSKDLPLSCPMEGMEIWNAHPRVYLPIEETGEELCPYCGTRYVLNLGS